MEKEAREFINSLIKIKNWRVDCAKELNYSIEETCEDLIFDVLALIDGCTGASDGFTLIDDNKVVNDGIELHHLYCDMLKEK